MGADRVMTRHALTPVFYRLRLAENRNAASIGTATII
jgi:hypothetical protein